MRETWRVLLCVCCCCWEQWEIRRVCLLCLIGAMTGIYKHGAGLTQTEVINRIETSGMSGLGTKWVREATNVISRGLFKIRFQYV